MFKAYKRKRLQSRIDSLRIDIAYWQVQLECAERGAQRMGSFMYFKGEISKAKVKIETKKIELEVAIRQLAELNTLTTNLK